jgi:NAD(P)-dependent dehydrogenase (short-subunit alcohol dehydrogenase family)
MTQHRILVTGGASGIGAGIARHWANMGNDVLITDVDDALGTALAQELGATFQHLDVTSVEQWADFTTQHKPFDVVFLNAGVASGGNIFGATNPEEVFEFDLGNYRRVSSINIDGVVLGVAHLANEMVKNGGGDIVVTASMAGLFPIQADPIYGLTKHAVLGFVKSLAPTLIEHNVCLSAICPFFVDTPLVNAESQALIRETGFDILTVDQVIDAAQTAVAERSAGAQWVIFPGLPVAKAPEPALLP